MTRAIRLARKRVRNAERELVAVVMHGKQGECTCDVRKNAKAALRAAYEALDRLEADATKETVK